MYLTRQDMINNIIRAFNDYGYKRSINKRLVFGFDRCSLTCSDCISLNSVVKELDNNMLDEVDFYISMPIDNFDLCISRLLYVAGKWKELCIYQMLINDTSYLFYVNICNECETHINVFFTTKDSNFCMSVDDQKVGIKIVKTKNTEKEFFNYDNKTTL